MWSRRQIEALIELYKANPCMYVPKHPLYKNRHARNAVMQEIKKELYKLGLDVSIADIKTKFCNLRTNFMAHNKKYVASQKSGASADDVQKPSLWYFSKLSFLLEHCTPRPSKDSLCSSYTISKEADVECDDQYLEIEFPEPVESMAFECDMVSTQGQENEKEATNIHILSNDLLASSVESTLDMTQSTPSASFIRSEGDSFKRKNRKKVDETEELYLKKATKALEKITSSLDQEDKNKSKKSATQIFGEFVTSQLEYLESDEDLSFETQQEITNVIWAARKKKLLKKKNH